MLRSVCEARVFHRTSLFLQSPSCSFSVSTKLRSDQRDSFIPRDTGVDLGEKKDWDSSIISKRIVEKLRKEGRLIDDETERHDAIARAQEYRLRRQMQQQEEEEKKRKERIEKELQANKERKERKEQEQQEENNKTTSKGKGWFSSWFSSSK